MQANKRQSLLAASCVLVLATTLACAGTPTHNAKSPPITPAKAIAMAPNPTAAPASTPTKVAGSPTGDAPTLQLTQASNAAIADLSATKSIPGSEVALVGSERVDWPDSRLDNPQPGKFYSQVVTPGWKLFLAARGQHYEYHATLDDSSVTLVGNSVLPSNFTPSPQR